MVNIFQNPKWKQAIEINDWFEILENLDEDNIDNNSNEKWGKNNQGNQTADYRKG